MLKNIAAINKKINSTTPMSKGNSLTKCMMLIMMMSILFTIPSFSQESSKGDLIINVNGIRNNKGKIRVSVFNSSNGFPGSSAKAKHIAEGEIKNNSSQILIKNVYFGEYAVTLVHDENDNQILETNFLGIPNEGIGMSNDAKAMFGPPKFEEAKFKFSKSNQNIKINMVYY